MKPSPVRSPVLFFFLKISLATQGLLWFHVTIRIFFSISMKNAIGMLIVIALHVYITLGSMDILVISIFQFIWMEYLSIIYVFFNFSHRCYSQFMVYRSFTSLIGFIHMYFIHFDAVVNCIVFFLRYVRLTMFLLVSCV